MQPQKRKSNLLDNPFYRLMGTIGDLVVLNVLWLVCCLSATICRARLSVSHAK